MELSAFCSVLILAAGLCSAEFDDGFPDVIKRAVFEEIIGNYYAFDPFLQSGRKGRELVSNSNNRPEFNTFSSFDRPNIQQEDDPTLYSIPPALTQPEGKDLMVFETDDTPIFITRPPINRDVIRIDEFQAKRSSKKEPHQELKNFDQEDYQQFPPFLTEQSVREQQQLSPASENVLPKYVIGVAGEEREDNFQQQNPVNRDSRQTIYRNQIRRRQPELDDSPFARRLAHFDDVPTVRRHQRSGSIRNLRNGYYVPSKVYTRI